jgi:hypothetical protein
MNCRNFYLLLTSLLFVCGSAASQPTLFGLCYGDNGDPDLNRPLTMTCNGSHAIDSQWLPLYVMHDFNGNGPDVADTVIGGTIIESFLPPGYLCISMLGLANIIPADSYYVMLNPGECCWTTTNLTMSPGATTINLIRSDWRCSDGTCFTLLDISLARPPLATQPELKRVYPNPFNPETRIEFELMDPGQVSVIIYNLNGQQVRTLTQQAYAAGSHTLVWDGRDADGAPSGSGLYFCRMTSGQFSDVKSLLLMK